MEHTISFLDYVEINFLDKKDLPLPLLQALMKRYIKNDGALLLKAGELIITDDAVYVLKQTVAFRPSYRINDAMRLEVIDETKSPLGKGAFGTVEAVAITVKLNPVFQQNQWTTTTLYREKSKTTQRTRAIKVFADLSKSLPDLKETEIAKKVGNTHAKALLQNQSTAYIVMDKLPGQSLSTVLPQLKTEQERMALTVALLKALKEQIADKDIIHMDIKPDNIMVDMASTPIEVNFIDFGLSDYAKEKNKNAKGTPLFIAPEVFSANQSASKQSDVFSLSNVIAKVWGVSDPVLLSSHTHAKNNRQFEYKDWVTKDVLTDKHLKAQLNQLIRAMHDVNPLKRMPLEHAIEKAERLINVFKLIPTRQAPDASEREKLMVDTLISTLKSEAQGFMFDYLRSGAQQHLKLEKIEGLTTLREKMNHMDVLSAMMETKELFPRIREGVLSTRVSQLLDELVDARLNHSVDKKI